MLFISMLIMGMIIGFIGIGGAGITIALLTVGFGVPIHTALAVALSAMVFTTMSGAYSHFKEGNVIPKTGAILGISGMIGAFMGANISNIIPSDILGKMSGSIMVLSAILLYTKVYQPEWLNKHFPPRAGLLEGNKLYIYGSIAGCLNGLISGTFGIGAAAFIQLTLMIIFGVPVLYAIGTCMMVILPISIAGGMGYILNGQLDFLIFIQTLVGQSVGAYLGAKLTRLAPRPILKFFMVAMSTSGGIVMLLFY